MWTTALPRNARRPPGPSFPVLWVKSFAGRSTVAAFCVFPLLLIAATAEAYDDDTYMHEKHEKELLLSSLSSLPLSWKNETMPCRDNWVGVTCHMDHRLESLHLDESFGVISTLPASWSGLHGLVDIVIMSNDTIKGSLPPEWSALRNISRLYLNMAGITATLPSSWSMLLNLTDLVLSNNALTGTLPNEWSMLENIIRIALDNNRLTGTLPSSWSRMIKAKKMLLNRNNLSGSLPPAWSSMMKMQRMSVSNNRIAGLLPVHWSTMYDMKVISLYSNGLKGPLPSEWGNFRSLLRMSLGTNAITGSLPNSWSLLTNVTRITLQDNKITGTLPQTWAKIGQIERMNLKNNSISGTLPLEWSGMASVQRMYLGNNKIGGSLPSEWSQMSSIQQMRLQNNLFGRQLPPEWTAMKNISILFMYDNAITGPLPVEWSNMMNMIGIKIYRNYINGTLPAQWSNLSRMQHLSLSKNSFTGTLPPAWSKMNDVRQMYLSRTFINGSLPREWSALSNLNRMYFHNNVITGQLPPEWGALKKSTYLNLQNNSLTGKLPPEWRDMQNAEKIFLAQNLLTGEMPGQWSTMRNASLIDISGNRLSGTLPISWSAMTALTRLMLAGNLLSGTLPLNWTTIEDLAIITLDSNRLTGTIPPAWIDSFLAVRERKVDSCDLADEGYTCFGDFMANSTFAAQLSLTNNLLSGVVKSSPVTDVAKPEIRLANLADGVNCLSSTLTGMQQRFCPPKSLIWPIAANLAATLIVATIAKAAFFRPSYIKRNNVVARSRLGLTAYFRRLYADHATVWLAAALAAASWSLFLISPAFEQEIIDPLWPSHTSTVVAPILARSLAATLQPLAWVIIFTWHIRAAIYSRLSLKASGCSSWTVIASQDSLEENLSTIRNDQTILAVMFTILTPVVATLNLAALPDHIDRWIPVKTPLHHESSVYEEPPVWMRVQTEVPSKLVAIGTASLLLVLYHALAFANLPDGFVASSAIRDACNSAAWKVSTFSAQTRALRSLFWLRKSGWVLLASLIIATFGLTTSGLLIEHPTSTEYDYYEDWQPYRAREAAGDPQPKTTSLGFGYVAVAAATLALQSILAVAWYAAAMRWTLVIGFRHTRQDTVFRKCNCSGTDARMVSRLWDHFVSSRSNAQRNICLVIIGLQMIPVLGAGHKLGWALVGCIWTLTCFLFAAALLIQDRPSTFGDLKDLPGFGLVILASDLAEVLACNLTHESVVGCMDGSLPSCCNGEPGGCMTCQLLLRRFPATLTRMRETLAISYRWQPSSEALVHPWGYAGRTTQVGMKNRVVGINMSRWQRQQLLDAIEGSGLPYVWIDALSIPAAVLGHSPDPENWLTRVSNTLLTRMMAVYAAAAQTVVLRSAEEDGYRYHQRAWTMQEYCGSRAVLIRSQDMVQGDKRPFTPEEAEEFKGLRARIQGSMRHALPLWIKRLDEQRIRGSVPPPTAWLWGIRAYARAQASVKCEKEVDKVRALLPLFLNTPVQDAKELKELVEEGLALAEGPILSNPGSCQEAMTTALSLLSQEAENNNHRHSGAVPLAPQVTVSMSSVGRSTKMLRTGHLGADKDEER